MEFHKHLKWITLHIIPRRQRRLRPFPRHVIAATLLANLASFYIGHPLCLPHGKGCHVGVPGGSRVHCAYRVSGDVSVAGDSLIKNKTSVPHGDDDPLGAEGVQVSGGIDDFLFR